MLVLVDEEELKKTFQEECVEDPLYISFLFVSEIWLAV